MRPAGLLGLAALIVIGVIVADFVVHPAGTKATGTALVNIEKPALNGLLGKTS